MGLLFVCALPRMTIQLWRDRRWKRRMEAITGRWGQAEWEGQVEEWERRAGMERLKALLVQQMLRQSQKLAKTEIRPLKSRGLPSQDSGHRTPPCPAPTGSSILASTLAIRPRPSAGDKAGSVAPRIRAEDAGKARGTPTETATAGCLGHSYCDNCREKLMGSEIWVRERRSPEIDEVTRTPYCGECITITQSRTKRRGRSRND